MDIAQNRQYDFARIFTKAMHELSGPPAATWPRLVDLSRNKVMLDIGGGSGAHSSGAASIWPELQAVVFELAPVCLEARVYIGCHDSHHRVSTHAGDMWKDPFPPADLHFYSWVYYAYPLDKRRFLTRKSFESLPSGGRIIIHEMLYHDQRTETGDGVGEPLSLLLSKEGLAFEQELSRILLEAGFVDVESMPSRGDWGIVTGRKDSYSDSQ